MQKIVTGDAKGAAASRATASTLVDTCLVGFDSAWSDRKGIPGAICALSFDTAGRQSFIEPILVDFAGAATFVEGCATRHARVLLAIDQPTIVENHAGMRPCERVVASVASWSGGAIQPANRGKSTMFGDGAPIWHFMDRLGFATDPRGVHQARTGNYIMEVFPALALLSFEPAFIASSKGGPRYNPARRTTFKLDAWTAVCAAGAARAERLGLPTVATWMRAHEPLRPVSKRHQDRLDAALCVVIAACWLCDRENCAMVGDIKRGFIAAPVVPAIRSRLQAAATALRARGVSVAVS